MERVRLEKQELADCVVEAATYVLQDILRYPPSRGQLEITPMQYTRDDLTVVSRISGDLSGELFFGLSPEVARGILQQMLRRDVTEFGRIEMSALSDLGGMISDSALALLEERGALCYSISGGVVCGRGQHATTLVLPSLAVPMRLVVGQLNINVLLAAFAPFAWAAPSGRLQGARIESLAPLGREPLPLAA